MPRLGRIATILIALPLSGCLTPQQYTEHQEKWGESYLGLTMYDFTKQTGMVPAEASTTPGGRVFKVNGRAATPVSLGYWGNPTRQTEKPCQMFLETRQVGPIGKPESWLITRVWSEGPCLDMINHPPL